MPFGGMLSLAGPAIGAGASLAGLFSGSPASKVQAPQQYNTPYRNEAGIMGYGSIDPMSQYNAAGQFLPQYMQTAQEMANNPYASQWMQGAQQAGAYGVGAGQNAYGAGGALTQNALSTLPEVQSLLAMGFDPQNALYSKMQQQNSDQTNAQLSRSGLGTTPYGAGVANQSNQNFNLGWQNNLLNRATQGANAAGSLMGAAGQGIQTGQGLQGGAAGQMLAGSGMPYNTLNNINTNALGALGQAGQYGQQAAQIPEWQQQQYMNYLGLANQTQNANTGAAQVGLQQANQGFNQNQQMGQQLGQSLAGLSKGWQNSPWGSNTGGFYGGSPSNNPNLRPY